MPAALDTGAENLIEIPVASTSLSKLPNLLYPLLLITILLPTYRYVLKDYHAFLALGPGGTPKTFAGYLRVTYLSLFTISNPFRPPPLAEAVTPEEGYLRQLPPRRSPRPTVDGIAPHRQTNQECTTDLHHLLRDAFEKFAAAFPSLIRTGNSCFEKHGLALFLSDGTQSICPETAHTDCSHLNQTCKDTGEICHLHAVVSSPAHQSYSGKLGFRVLWESPFRYEGVPQDPVPIKKPRSVAHIYLCPEAPHREIVPFTIILKYLPLTTFGTLRTQACT